MFRKKLLLLPLLAVLLAAGARPSPTPSPTASPTALPALEAALQVVRKTPASTARKLEECRVLFYLAQATPEEDARSKLFGEGRELAAQVRASEPRNPGGLLWWAAHEGEIADIRRGFYGLGAIGKVRDALVELKALDPTYDHGAADRALGRLYERAPGFISIGSSGKAEEHFKAALAIDPGYPGNQSYYAEFLLEEGEKDLARELAQAVLSSPWLARSPLERAHWTAIARKILEKTAPGK